MSLRITSASFCSFVFLTLLACDRSAVPPATTSNQTPGFAMSDTAGATASAENPQVVTNNTFEDFHYAFQIRRPSTRWRIMNEANTASVTPDAVMCMVNPGSQAFFVVLPELLEDTSIDRYVQKITQEFDGFDAANDVERIEIDGQPAVRFFYEGTVEDIPFTYVVTIAKRDNFFYQLMGWTFTKQFAAARPELLQVSDSFRFVTSRTPTVRNSTLAVEEQSVTWEIADGVYRNAPYRFQLNPAAGLRFMGEVELAGIDIEASAGRTGTEGSFYQTYTVESIRGLNQSLFQENARTIAMTQFGDDVTPVVSNAIVGGIPAEQFAYPKVDLDGVAIDYTITLFVRDDVHFRIDSWWASGEAESVGVLLDQSYESLTWLDAAATEALHSRLQRNDLNNFVTPNSSLRNGRYRDFSYGAELKVPRGLWKAIYGDAIKWFDEDAELILTRPEDGIFLTYASESAEGTHEEYHELVCAMLGVPPDEPVEIITHPDGDLRLSKTRDLINNLPISYRVITAKRDDRAIQLVLSGYEPVSDTLDQLVPELAAGFVLREKVTGPVTVMGPMTADHRLGYRLTVPEKWRPFQPDSSAIAAIGSMTGYQDKSVACIAMGICATWGFDQDLAIDGMVSKMNFATDLGSRRETTATLAGLPARFITMTGKMSKDKVTAMIWLAQKDRTNYIFFVFGESRRVRPKNADNYAGFFKLLD